jgi:hypothetical protein
MTRTTNAALAAMTLALATGGFAAAAHAQDTGQQPRFGEVNLRAGFTPDPVQRNVTAGGRTDASNLGGECTGMITDAPTFRVNYEAGGIPLYVYVYADADATLVINEPNGSWDCNDDGNGSGGTNPGIRFRHPTTGQYDIWVGSLSGGRPSPARLVITEIEGNPQPQRHGPPPRRGRGHNRH